MIPKEFVTFETAKLLKQAGFPQDETFAYSHDGVLLGHAPTRDCHIAAPTQAQAMRWLREEKDVYVSIGRIRRGNVIDAGLGLSHKYYATINDDYVNSSPICDTYEEAAEAGIQAACKYLMKKGGEG